MADHGAPTDAADAKPAKKRGKLLLIAVPVVLAGIGAGLWFSGILPSLLGHKPKTEQHDPMAKAMAAPPVYVDIPEIIANLNVPGKRPSYMKLHAKLELGDKTDEPIVTAAMPRILDLFQTYLRDMRPDELRGSEGSYRLREELIARATAATAPAHITDILFQELIIE